MTHTPILLYLDGTMGSNRWREIFLAALAKRNVKVTGIYDPTKFADKDANSAARAAANTVLVHVGATRTAGMNTIDLDALTMVAIEISQHHNKIEVIFDADGLGTEISQQMQIARRRMAKMCPKATIHGSFREVVDHYLHKFLL